MREGNDSALPANAGTPGVLPGVFPGEKVDGGSVRERFRKKIMKKAVGESYGLFVFRGVERAFGVAEFSPSHGGRLGSTG
jgi:hypothetical protein